MTESHERLLRSILAGFPGFLVLKSKQLAFEVVNPAFCQFLGKGPEEIVGKRDADLFPAAEAALAQKEDAAALTLGMPRKTEQAFTGANGTGWFEVTRSPIFDEDGEPMGLLLFANDLTAFKEREKAVGEGEARLAAADQKLAEAAARAQRLEGELQAAQAQAAQTGALEAQLGETKQALEARQEELQRAQAQGAHLQEQVQTAAARLKEAAQQIAALRDHGAKLDAALAEREVEVAKAREAREEAAALARQLLDKLTSG
jgi:PAS domain S-box-containing protein